MPIKEGLQGTSDDLITVIGAHGSTATTLERLSLNGTPIGTIPVGFSACDGGNVGIGNVAITADGRYMCAPLETANAIVKIDLTNGAIVASCVDGIYPLNTSNDSVSRFIQGFTETGGSAGPSGLSAPRYLQFDTNFVDAPDAGLVPEPGTIALGLAALACFGALPRSRRRSN